MLRPRCLTALYDYDDLYDSISFVHCLLYTVVLSAVLCFPVGRNLGPIICCNFNGGGGGAGLRISGRRRSVVVAKNAGCFLPPFNSQFPVFLSSISVAVAKAFFPGVSH